MTRTLILLLILIVSTTLVANAGESALSISIAVPSHAGETNVDYRDRTSHFHVVLTNTSQRLQRVWKEWCSWGYYALAFELADGTGKRWRAKKAKIAWTRNFPDWWTLEPDERLVFDVYFGDEGIWEGFPRPKNGSQTVSITAVYEVPPDKEAKTLAVWTGRVVSKTHKMTFRRQTSEKE